MVNALTGMGKRVNIMILTFVICLLTSSTSSTSTTSSASQSVWRFGGFEYDSVNAIFENVFSSPNPLCYTKGKILFILEQSVLHSPLCSQKSYNYHESGAALHV